MKHLLSVAALACGLMIGSGAMAADYSVIHLETTVDAPIDHTWSKVGGYCQIQDWMKRLTPCVLIGDGGVGSIRKLGPQGFIEVEVAATKYSYTYAQPDNKILYHGTLAAEPMDGGKKTKLLYTLIYDQEPDGDQAAKDKDRAGRTTNFTAALATMKALSEAK
jgi:hypothetical protein